MAVAVNETHAGTERKMAHGCKLEMIRQQSAQEYQGIQ